jgi:hypothetical protein
MINQSSLLRLFILLISISGITRVFFSSQTSATAVSMIADFIGILVIIIFFKNHKFESIEKKKLIYYFLFYSIVIFIYSLFVSESYEQSRYVFTVYLPSLVLPLIAIISSDLKWVLFFIKNFLVISIPLSVFIYFSDLKGMSDFTHYVSFIYVLLLFLPYLKIKWKIIILSISLISFFYDLESRSNLLNLSFLLILFLMSYFKKLNFKTFFNSLRIILISLPIIFVVLAFYGINIFLLSDGFKEDYVISGTENKNISLVNDSRTGVYLDAITGVAKNNDYLFGLSAAGYHDTFLQDLLGNSTDTFLAKGRLGSEVGILEYYLRGGGIFVILIFLIHFYASKYAINRSNNLLCKYLGVYVAFRLFFLFIEAQVALNLSTISTFLVIGLCLSSQFRKLTDKQIMYYLKSI